MPLGEIEMTICKRCKRDLKHYAFGFCQSCYEMHRYNTNPKHKKNRLKINRKYRAKRERENCDNIYALCKKFGFSDDVSLAVAVDGDVLDEKLKEK